MRCVQHLQQGQAGQEQGVLIYEHGTARTGKGARVKNTPVSSRSMFVEDTSFTTAARQGSLFLPTVGLHIFGPRRTAAVFGGAPIAFPLAN